MNQVTINLNAMHIVLNLSALILLLIILLLFIGITNLTNLFIKLNINKLYLIYDLALRKACSS